MPSSIRHPSRIRHLKRYIALQILALLAWAAGLPALAGPPTVQPTPDWVEPVAVEPRKIAADDGVEALLWDTQTWVSGARVVRYSHAALRPVSSAGLGTASAVAIVFDPAYQSHAWHMLRIVRGDAVIDALPRAEIHESTGAADQGDMVRGSTRVTAFLHDVRVGDVVEYAYSIDGDQPALGGRFAERLELVGGAAIGQIRHRVVWPGDRTLQIRAHGSAPAPEHTREGDRDVYVWQVLDAVPTAVESHTPIGFDANPWVQLSEFATWSEVVEWALPMYASEQMVTPELERLAQSFRGDGSTTEAAARATRFVQDDVRYLGFELGEGSLRPRAPDLVAARRFGDCKDKSLLLITLLRLLGVEAVPVLVSTYDGAALQERLPSPYDFDHVIVRATIDGRPIWIDSTASYERGALVERASPPFGMALPIAAGVVAPEPIAVAAGSEPGTRVRELFELSDTNGGALLSVSTLYRGADANRRRAELATAERSQLQKDSLELYTGLYGRMRVARPLEIRDDEARNEIEVQEFYALDELWQRGAALQLWRVASDLVHPEQPKGRRAPLALDHPRHVVHEIDVLLPIEVAVAETDERTRAPGIELRSQTSYSSRHLHLRQDYRTLAQQVEVVDLAEYGAALERIEAGVAYWVSEAPGSAPGLLGLPGLRSPVSIAALIGLGLYLGWLGIRDGRARVRRRRFERISEAGQGEAPDRPLLARSLEELEHHVSGLSCGCASSQMSVEREPARFRYMDRDVWQQSARCADCEVRVTRYFVLEPDAADDAAEAAVRS